MSESEMQVANALEFVATGRQKFAELVATADSDKLAEKIYKLKQPEMRAIILERVLAAQSARLGTE